MWTLIGGVAFGGLLLVVGIVAWRDGELAIGARTLARGEPLFAVAVALALAGGAALCAFSLRAALVVESATARHVEHDRFALTIPGTWEPENDLADMMSRDGSMAALAFSGDGDELLLTWPRAPQSGSATDLAERLRDPSIAYRTFTARESPDGIRVDMRYPSPRGDVVACVLARQRPAGIDMLTALCSHQGDAARCEAAIASLAWRPD